MKKSQSNLIIQRFVSATGKNQYLLTSAGEAAVIDVSESYDEICKIWGPKSMSLILFSLKRLSYNIPAKTTVYTGSGDLTVMGNEGWIQCLRSA
jgi:hypothetical protein